MLTLSIRYLNSEIQNTQNISSVRADIAYLGDALSQTLTLPVFELTPKAWLEFVSSSATCLPPVDPILASDAHSRLGSGLKHRKLLCRYSGQALAFPKVDFGIVGLAGAGGAAALADQRP